jgi:GNAT superfamily N-acetyltransferase
LIIREINISEIGFLEEMLYEAIFVEIGKPKLPKSIIKEPSLANYIHDFGIHKLDKCLVALENDVLIGACWGRLFSEENKGYGFIDSETPELSIAMKKDFRNKGIGSILIKAIIEIYKKQEIQSISLSVDKNNPAFTLYKRIGFETKLETEKSAEMRLQLSK